MYVPAVLISSAYPVSRADLDLFSKASNKSLNPSQSSVKSSSGVFGVGLTKIGFHHLSVYSGYSSSPEPSPLPSISSSS